MGRGTSATPLDWQIPVSPLAPRERLPGSGFWRSPHPERVAPTWLPPGRCGWVKQRGEVWQTSEPKWPRFQRVALEHPLSTKAQVVDMPSLYSETPLSPFSSQKGNFDGTGNQCNTLRSTNPSKSSSPTRKASGLGILKISSSRESGPNLTPPAARFVGVPLDLPPLKWSTKPFSRVGGGVEEAAEIRIGPDTAHRGKLLVRKSRGSIGDVWFWFHSV